MNETKADVLIFGSSKANHHYYPETFEKELNLNYYNVGRDGNFIFYHYAVLKSILKRHNPKLIILDLKNDEFAQEPDSYDRLASLLPYYKSHPEINEVIEIKSKFEKVKLLSNIYPYNSAILTIFVGNSEFNKKRKADNKGYVPLKREMSEDVIAEKRSSYKLDTNKINIYKSFIAECLKAKTKVIVVCSPSYNPQSDGSSMTIGKNISKDNGVDFFDYSNDSIFSKKLNYFSDPEHLNEMGSMKFSELLCQKIKGRQ
ncbi:MAG: hypothetical protein ABIP51_02200 [Bacteroidia bacterium]